MSDYLVYDQASLPGGLNEVLVKEDVSDLITNLFPLDTPLHQVLSRRPMHNVFCEAPVDTFANVNRDAVTAFDASASPDTGGLLAKPESHVYTSPAAQYPAKLTSVAEIQGIQFEVSDTNRAMEMYGIQDRFAYEALKTTQSVVNNFEFSFWWGEGTVPGGADFDTGGGAAIYAARQTQGLMYWILHSGLARRFGALAGANVDGNGNDFDTVATNNLYGAAATTAFDAGGLTLDQTMFKQDIMGPWWNLTGRTSGAVGFASPRVKNLFSQFALTANGPVNERSLEAASKLIVDTVDYYETDYGIISINLCRYLSEESQTRTIATRNGAGDVNVTGNLDQSLVLMRPQGFQIGTSRGVHFSPLGKDGDRERGLVRGEQGLVCLNPQGATAAVNCVS